MKALVFAAAASIAVGPNTLHYDGMPPERYRGEAVAVVVFTRDVEPFCGKAPEPLVRLACTTSRKGVPVIYLPEPCPLGELEQYASLVCHEVGHVKGWSSHHEL